jgi:hypothetical protein
MMGRTVRPGQFLALVVLASLTSASLAVPPRGAPPAEAAPAVEERPALAEFDVPEPRERKVVRVTAPERTQAAPAEPVSAVIPGAAMIAYEAAADTVSCGLHWSVLAAIGRVESNHGRFGGTRVLGDGTVQPAIRGMQLDGRAGIATIRDTDGGRLDGDVEYDRAIGPMQFIPTTWQRYAADGNGDGRTDPDNFYDAALAAARYLCADGGDLSVPEQLSSAVFRYNRSQSYVDMVLMLADHYRTARLMTAPTTGEPPSVVGTPAPPPAPSPAPASVSAAVPATSPPPSTPPSTPPATPPTPPPATPPPPAPECPSTEDVSPEPAPSTPPAPEPLLPLPLVDVVLEELIGTKSTTEPEIAC